MNYFGIYKTVGMTWKQDSSSNNNRFMAKFRYHGWCLFDSAYMHAVAVYKPCVI